METISSMAHTAAKAVWGDGAEHDEPVSGVQGDVSKGEPYDAGNMEPRQQAQEVGTNLKDKGLSSSNLDSIDDSESSNNAADNYTTDKPMNDVTSSNPQERDTDAVKESVMGDGPRPLAEVAREHGGDAGNYGTTANPDGGQSGTDREPEHDESQGTGEQYVKTTGLQADGGDFDATKPGAGREADRLMEQKGIGGHERTGSNLSKADSSSSGSGKPSLKERIKDKLHIHKS